MLFRYVAQSSSEFLLQLSLQQTELLEHNPLVFRWKCW